MKVEEGKEWEYTTSGAFRFESVRDEKAARGGILLKSTRFFADSESGVQKILRVEQFAIVGLWVSESNNKAIALMT